eukprot:SAG11_NODE_429_length_9534_cov_14.689242_4_plen_76_part_00
MISTFKHEPHCEAKRAHLVVIVVLPVSHEVEKPLSLAFRTRFLLRNRQIKRLRSCLLCSLRELYVVRVGAFNLSR